MSTVNALALEHVGDLVQRCGAVLGITGIAVTPNMRGEHPNGRARGRRIDVTPALLTADDTTQAWYSAHEVGHLHYARQHPVATRATSNPVLIAGLCSLVATWALFPSIASEVVNRAAGLACILVIGAAITLWVSAWSANSRHEEYQADDAAVTMLRALGYDPAAVAGRALTQAYVHPRR